MNGRETDGKILYAELLLGRRLVRDAQQEIKETIDFFVNSIWDAEKVAIVGNGEHEIWSSGEFSWKLEVQMVGEQPHVMPSVRKVIYKKGEDPIAVFYINDTSIVGPETVMIVKQQMQNFIDGMLSMFPTLKKSAMPYVNVIRNIRQM